MIGRSAGMMLARHLLLALTFVSSSCGRDGDGGSHPVDTPSPGVRPGVVEPGPKDVRGRFYIGSTGSPAVGYEVWLVDYTAPGYRRFPLDDEGGLAIPLAAFVEDHVYSLHLVRDLRLYGDVDVAPATAGVQAAFRYAGGYGFNLGDVVAETRRDGTVDVVTPGLVGRLAGGFTLAPEQSVALDRHPTPQDVSRFAVGGQLVVFDPATLLHAFHRRQDNPDLYARAVGAHARIGFDVDAKATTRVFAAESGSWLSAARLSLNDDQDYAQAAPWSAAGFELPQLSMIRFGGAVLTGRLLEPRPLVVMKLQPESGPQTTLPRLAGRLLALPPLVRAAAADGGLPLPIDYAGSAANGLNRPFCRTGAVRLVVDAPQEVAGSSVVDDGFDRVDVVLDYFASSAGLGQSLVPVSTDFPVAYRSGRTEALAADLERSWVPSQRLLRFTLGSSLARAGSHELSLPSEVFPDRAGGATVQRVRLRIYYRSELGASEGGSAVWLTQRGC